MNKETPSVILASPQRRLALLCLATFLGFLTIGVPLPVISLYVHDHLGFSNVIVGTAVGIQFLATILSRTYAGRLADVHGARPIMLQGMLGCAASGLMYMLAVALPVAPALQLAVLFAGRLTLGYGESLLVTGMLAWGMGTVGPSGSGKVMSWTGMAIYGSLALGAPVGLMLYGWGQLMLVGAVVVLLPMLAMALVWKVPASAVTPGERRSLASVLGRIWQPGLALALQGVGFAALGAFIGLYFAEQGWSGAGLTLTCFGLAFALTRVFFGHLPDRLGGPPVAIVSLLVETLGLLLLFAAPNAALAMVGAAVTGFGSSLVFPALGLVVVSRVEPQVRASALGGYTAFQDVAYMLTGPLTGLLVGSYGYPVAFLAAALAAALGLLVVLPLRHPRKGVDAGCRTLDAGR